MQLVREYIIMLLIICSVFFGCKENVKNKQAENQWLKTTQDTLYLVDRVVGQENVELPIKINKISKEQFTCVWNKKSQRVISSTDDDYFIETDSAYQIWSKNIIKKTFSKEDYSYRNTGYDDEICEEKERQSKSVISLGKGMLLEDYGDATLAGSIVGVGKPVYTGYLIIWKFFETGPVTFSMFSYLSHEWIPVKAVWKDDINLLLEVKPILPGKRLSRDKEDNRFIQIHFLKEVK